MNKVSIIIPCYNEEDTISLLLEAIKNQSYPRDNIEVIIADGMSTDRTRLSIDDFRLCNPGLVIHIIDNHKRSIPSGLNRALEAASGQYIIRLDAHCIPSREYIALCIKKLDEEKGDIVGGVWRIMPGGDTWISSSIASAASHPLGVGDARYRIGGKPQVVDTVPFGAYRRQLIDEIGIYDESLLSNEDYEFNVRARLSGKVIWLDPQISSIYFARTTIKALVRQYWRYGFWKLRMLIRYPNTFRWRQTAGLFVLTWPLFGVFSIWYPFFGWLLIIEALMYSSALLVSGIQSANNKNDLTHLVGVPIAIAAMHFSWGSGFLYSAINYLFQRKRKILGE